MLEFRFIFGENGFEIAKDLRSEIFSNEGIKKVTDEFEDDAYHFVGYDGTLQIASARLLKIGEKNFKISYVAVRENYRRQYVGDLIMRALADKAVSLGGISVILEAPILKKKFFEFEDYEAYGDIFEEDGIEYIMMKKDLTKVQHCRGCEK